MGIVAQECERQKASADRSAWQRASFRYKFAVHALRAGERRIADVLLRVTPLPTSGRIDLRAHFECVDQDDQSQRS